MADDPRITDQETYLMDMVLVAATFGSSSGDSDHDHCAFCWAKFMPEPYEGFLRQGYCTTDRYRWVCPTCFEDFRQHFRWTLAEPD